MFILCRDRCYLAPAGFADTTLTLKSGDKEADERQGLGLINHIHQKSAHDGDNHEGLAAHAITVFHGGHVHNGRGSCAQAMSAQASAHNSGVVVLAQQTEDHKVGDKGSGN